MIYTMGYAGLTMDRLIEVVETYCKADVLFDVRSSPRSRNPVWNQSNLTRWLRKIIAKGVSILSSPRWVKKLLTKLPPNTGIYGREESIIPGISIKGLTLRQWVKSWFKTKESK